MTGVQTCALPISIVMSSEKKFYLFYREDDKYLYGKMLSVYDTNTDVVESNFKLLSDIYNSGEVIEAISLSKNKIYVIYSAYSDNMLIASIFNVKDEDITLYCKDDISTVRDNNNINIFITLLYKNRFLIANNHDNKLFAVMLDNSFNVKKHENELEEIIGIAKTAGTAGEIIKVYVPKIEEEV